MNKIVQVLLTALALAGMYSAIPRNSSKALDPVVVSAGQTVLIADGSDPMPLCRRRSCK
jgi:hypothetical protein